MFDVQVWATFPRWTRSCVEEFRIVPTDSSSDLSTRPSLWKNSDECSEFPSLASEKSSSPRILPRAPSLSPTSNMVTIPRAHHWLTCFKQQSKHACLHRIFSDRLLPDEATAAGQGLGLLSSAAHVGVEVELRAALRSCWARVRGPLLSTRLQTVLRPATWQACYARNTGFFNVFLWVVSKSHSLWILFFWVRSCK